MKLKECNIKLIFVYSISAIMSLLMLMYIF